MIRKPVVTRFGIYGFFEEYRWLSNFHLCPVYIDGLMYTSSEAAFQAQKTDKEDVRILFTKMSPRDSKVAGREVDLIENWNHLKVLAMIRVLTAKFQQNVQLSRLLQATGALYLEETNDWNDMYWGKTVNGGLNLLGHSLMHVRDTL